MIVREALGCPSTTLLSSTVFRRRGFQQLTGRGGYFYSKAVYLMKKTALGDPSRGVMGDIKERGL
jgi:hypothetical protein